MSQATTKQLIKPLEAGIRGVYIPPGDKSISHRAVMIASLAKGISRIENFLPAEDCIHTIEAMQALGVSIRTGKTEVEVRGVGLNGLKPPKKEIDCGNSGTTLRLLAGILAGQPFETTLTGDASLTRRPMKRVVDPLTEMGATISGAEHGNFAPLTIQGGNLRGIYFNNKLSSAQVKSALMFAGLYAEGETVIHEPVLSRDHTERLFELFKADFEKDGNNVIVRPSKKLAGLDFRIPSDPSSAAFFIVAAIHSEDSFLTVKDVCLNPTRTGFLEVLKRMGAKIEVKVGESDYEPTGDIKCFTGFLRGTAISGKMIPRLIDELPILMVASAMASGDTVISGAKELRVKETDRIHAMCANLKALGVGVTEREDGCVIHGKAFIRGGTVPSFGDHRTAMSMAIAGLLSQEGVEIEDVDCVSTSYPGFFEDLTAFSS
ncbi:MAG: 3-phosphoshikimate 1-carboxyvinyltransferase [Candidatus Omnitrophica bacterium]|nr:3-phosphoshikimate 1-carboxyvinyltransferase [Candidatus Omnitrophota bacterium]